MSETTASDISGGSGAQASTPADQTEEPYFPASAPQQLSDQAIARELLGDTLRRLAEVVEASESDLDRRTPCEDYDVTQLRDHVLGWLQFFAAAFADPRAAGVRPDPENYRVAADGATRSGGCRRIVEESAAALDGALASGVLQGRIRLSQSWMDGPAAVGMVLGEYLVHGWDLARALDRPWQPSPRACAVAREFFGGVIAPEYRGGEHGFFGAEIAVPDDAPELDRLLGFAGRDPGWGPAAG